MDDARIKQLSDEVMAELGRAAAPPGEPTPAPARPALAVVSVTIVHPSHSMLDVPSGSTDGRCCLDPGRPCVQSGQCRTLGH
ncbi:MAG TPA: hypothetical protein VFM88_20335 [Vicinamibacteria bacterium]|nr:hypothetical protein [Vicinamibacteria bacterium]